MTLLREVEVDGGIVDVRFADGVITAVSAGSPAAAEDDDVVDGGGNALLPGLHDHHVHLLATAAARSSIDVCTGLAALATAPAGSGWVRAVNSLDDDLDADRIDDFVADRPVRVQHHSGALWTLNTAAMAALDVDPATQGRLFRADDWLREQLRGSSPMPDLLGLGDELASYGITGVTDATPGLDSAALGLLGDALPQRVTALADRKIVIADHELSDYDELRDEIHALHDAGQPVAVHCVTREALALLVAVLDDVGAFPGDRVEHASVSDPALGRRLAALGVAVVTQPGFIRSRGDRYLAEVEASDHADLYRYAGLLADGVTVIPSSDAPYGPLDPWAVIRSARDRTTAAGQVLGAAEAVETRIALDGYLRPAAALAAPRRRIEVGAPADLVLLNASLGTALDDPSAARVRRTWIAGRPVFTAF